MEAVYLLATPFTKIDSVRSQEGIFRYKIDESLTELGGRCLEVDCSLSKVMDSRLDEVSTLVGLLGCDLGGDTETSLLEVAGRLGVLASFSELERRLGGFASPSKLSERLCGLASPPELGGRLGGPESPFCLYDAVSPPARRWRGEDGSTPGLAGRFLGRGTSSSSRCLEGAAFPLAKRCF